VAGDAALKAAFDALGAAVWNTPESTPHGGTNYYKTKTGISWEEAVHFLAGCGYAMVQQGGNPPPQGGNPHPQAGNPPPVPVVRRKTKGKRGVPPVPANLLPVRLSEVCAAAGDIEQVRGVFSQANRLHRYRPGGAEGWPAGSGVYVVWKLDPAGDTVLYIGKTGEFKRDKNGDLRFGGGTLAQRYLRWHPYSFTTAGPHANHFEYGPKASVNALKKLPEEGRYKCHIPYAVIAVDCYVTDGIERDVSPSFLEVLLMQMYVAQHGTLPPANNAL
jgi:hypothetical protein